MHDQNYILGPGPDTAVLFGGILEVIVALAGIGTAVALYPVLKRQNQGAALGLVGSPVLEAAGILAGVACLLAIVTLRQTGAGNGALITGQTLAILYDRIFLLSQSLMPVERPLAGLPVVQVASGAAGSSGARIHWSAPAPGFLVRRVVRRLGTKVHGDGARRTPGRAI